MSYVDPFLSPLPVRRNGQVENSAPFLRDLSPIPFSFQTRQTNLGPPPFAMNLEFINTPVPPARVSNVDPINSIILDWGEPIVPNDIIEPSREEQ